jgi:hypothetical protein
MQRRWWPVLLLGVLSFIWLGRILLPPPGLATGGADIRALFVPWLSFARDSLREGNLPLWDPFHFAGYPFLSNPQVAFFYPPTWLAWLLPVRLAISLQLLLHLWVMGGGMWLFLRQNGATQTGALAGALTFTFSGFTGARLLAGHAGLLATVAWLPWLLLGLQWAARARHWRAGVLAGMPLALAFLAGHTASLLYLGIIWFAFALHLLCQQRTVLVVRQLLLAGAFGAALSAVQLLPFGQLSLASTRATGDFEFATNYSLPPAHLITVLVPEYYGEPTRAGYWSVPVFEELTFYAGVTPLLLLPLAVRRPRRYLPLYLALMVLGLWLAMGRYSPLYQLAYDLLTPLRLARAPGRFALLFTFAAAALTGLTLSDWQRFHDAPLASRLLRAAVAVAAVATAAALGATGALFAGQHPSETSGRLWHQVGGWTWLLIMVVVGGGLLWAFLRPNRLQVRRALAAVILLLILADLWQLSYKFVRLEPTAPTAMWSDAFQLIGDTEERVLPWGLPVFEQNGAGQAGLRSVFGYNALEPAGMAALTGSIPDPRSTAYDVLAVGYVVAEAPQDAYTEGDRAITLAGQQGNAWVYRRARTLPLVRLVSSIEVIKDSAAAISRLHEAGFDPSTTAIVASQPDCILDGTAESATATLIDHEPARWEIATESSGAALLVVAEASYPGWRVRIDGARAQPVTAYTALRAVCVPAGRHLATWEYRPTVFIAGGLVTSIALVLAALAAITLRRETKRPAQQEEPGVPSQSSEARSM